MRLLCTALPLVLLLAAPALAQVDFSEPPYPELLRELDGARKAADPAETAHAVEAMLAQLERDPHLNAWRRARVSLPYLVERGHVRFQLLAEVPAKKPDAGEAAWREAVEGFEAVLEVDPANVVAHAYLGRLVALRGDIRTAEEHLLRAAAGGYAALEAVLALPELRPLATDALCRKLLRTSPQVWLDPDGEYRVWLDPARMAHRREPTWVHKIQRVGDLLAHPAMENARLIQLAAVGERASFGFELLGLKGTSIQGFNEVLTVLRGDTNLFYALEPEGTIKDFRIVMAPSDPEARITRFTLHLTMSQPPAPLAPDGLSVTLPPSVAELRPVIHRLTDLLAELGVAMRGEPADYLRVLELRDASAQAVNEALAIRTALGEQDRPLPEALNLELDRLFQEYAALSPEADELALSVLTYDAHLKLHNLQETLEDPGGDPDPEEVEGRIASVEQHLEAMRKRGGTFAERAAELSRDLDGLLGRDSAPRPADPPRVIQPEPKLRDASQLFGVWRAEVDRTMASYRRLHGQRAEQLRPVIASIRVEWTETLMLQTMEGETERSRWKLEPTATTGTDGVWHHFQGGEEEWDPPQELYWESDDRIVLGDPALVLVRVKDE